MSLLFIVFLDQDTLIQETIKLAAKRYKIKSRNYTAKGIVYVVEILVKDINKIIEAL